MDYNIVKPIWHIFKIYIKVRVINFERKATHNAAGHGYAYEKNFKES